MELTDTVRLCLQVSDFVPFYGSILIVNLRSRTVEERRQQTLCDNRRDNNYDLKKKTLIHQSSPFFTNRSVTFVTPKRLRLLLSAVMLRKLTILGRDGARIFHSGSWDPHI